MSLKPRAAFGYTVAILIPLVLGAQWDKLSVALQVLPALLFLLFVSLIARFCGFGPALVYIGGSAIVLSALVFRYMAPEPSPMPLRVGLYVVVSITIASISRRRSAEAREAERALEHLSGRLLRLQDEERRRIARHLHDTVAQNLAAIRLNLVAASRSPAAADAEIASALKESTVLAEQSISEIRTIAYLLHPPLIDEAGLAATLRWFVRGFEARSGIKVSLVVPDPMERLPPETETTLFRIVQEALTNIQRHSGSPVARIRLDVGPREIRLEIADEGVGIPEDLRGNEGALIASGVGIAGIRQRARDGGGRMQVESDSSGTRVTVVLPAAKV